MESPAWGDEACGGFGITEVFLRHGECDMSAAVEHADNWRWAGVA